jgi:amino acid transporter
LAKEFEIISLSVFGIVLPSILVIFSVLMLFIIRGTSRRGKFARRSTLAAVVIFALFLLDPGILTLGNISEGESFVFVVLPLILLLSLIWAIARCFILYIKSRRDLYI